MVKPLYVRLGSWLFLLVFVAMLTGRFTLARITPALPAFDLRLAFLCVILIGVLIWLGGSHRHLPKPRKVAGPGLFLVWLGWLSFSSVWAPPGARLEPVLLDLAFLASFTILGWAVMRRLPSETIDRIWKWMLIAGLIYFMLAMASGPDAQGRYAAPGGGPNVFVRIMVLAAIAALYYVTVKKRLWPLFTVPLFATGAALSGSRGGLASALVILLIFSVPAARRLGTRRVAGTLAVAGLAGIGLAFIGDNALIKFIQERYVQQTFVERYTSGRNEIVEDALWLYRENPVFGVGLDGYFALQVTPGAFEYPHNLLLATMVESGTIGGLFLIACFVAFLISASKVKPLPDGVLYALGASCYLGFTSMFSGDYYDTRLMWFFLGIAAFQATQVKALNDCPVTSPSQRLGKAPGAPSKVNCSLPSQAHRLRPGCHDDHGNVKMS